MLKKYYTADMVNGEGALIGSCCYCVWFFISTHNAWSAMNSDRPDGTNLIRFRRVK